MEPASVRPSEAALIGVARVLVGVSMGRLGDAHGPQAPKQIGPTAARLLEETLARGVVLWLCRAGGWQSSEWQSGRGRLWQRASPVQLGFTETTIKALSWAMGDGTVKRPRLKAAELSIADELVVTLLSLRLVDHWLAPQLFAQPLVRTTPLVWLLAADELAYLGPSAATTGPTTNEWALRDRGDSLLTQGDLLGAISAFEALVAIAPKVEHQIALLDILNTFVDKKPGDDARRRQATTVRRALTKDTDAAEVDALLLRRSQEHSAAGHDGIPSVAAWTRGERATIFEALAPLVARRAEDLFVALRGELDLHAMIAVGEAIETVFGGFIDAAVAAGRRDLTLPLVAAVAGALARTPIDAPLAPDLPAQESLSTRTRALRAAGSWLRIAIRLRRLVDEARSAHYLDDDYAAAQLFLRRAEAFDSALAAKAEAMHSRLTRLDAPGG